MYKPLFLKVDVQFLLKYYQWLCWWPVDITLFKLIASILSKRPSVTWAAMFTAQAKSGQVLMSHASSCLLERNSNKGAVHSKRWNFFCKCLFDELCTVCCPNDQFANQQTWTSSIPFPSIQASAPSPHIHCRTICFNQILCGKHNFQ